MKKIDLVKLVEEVDKEEMIEGGVHKIFALTCLYKFIEMQEEAINYTHSCKSDSELLHTEVFNLANKLAINGYGNEALRMHLICNGM